MTLAIGKLMDPETGAKLGTVFAVTGRLALTAFHCVEDRESGRVRCEWPGAISHAVVEDGDRENDVALLRLDAELPQKLDPVRLATDVTEHARFSAPGNPAAVGGASLFAISGEVTWLEGALGGVSVMQLASPESAAELSLHGMQRYARPGWAAVESGRCYSVEFASPRPPRAGSRWSCVRYACGDRAAPMAAA